MAAKRIRVKQGEDLSASNIANVAKLLSAEKPITKKEACERLGISYNTSRLNRIIEDHHEEVERDKRLRKKLRGKPLDNQETHNIVSLALEGESVASISASTYRSKEVIEDCLKKYNLPKLGDIRSHNYFHPPLLDEDGAKESYKPGDLVYSARYQSPAYIKSLFQASEEHGNVYLIQLPPPREKTALQPWYELGDLSAVAELGISLPFTDGDEAKELVARTIIESKKKDST